MSKNQVDENYWMKALRRLISEEIGYGTASISEALASGWGYKKHSSLLADLGGDARPKSKIFDTDRFIKKLNIEAKLQEIVATWISDLLATQGYEIVDTAGKLLTNRRNTQTTKSKVQMYRHELNGVVTQISHANIEQRIRIGLVFAFDYKEIENIPNPNEKLMNLGIHSDEFLHRAMEDRLRNLFLIDHDPDTGIDTILNAEEIDEAIEGTLYSTYWYYSDTAVYKVPNDMHNKIGISPCWTWKQGLLMPDESTKPYTIMGRSQKTSLESASQSPAQQTPPPATP